MKPTHIGILLAVSALAISGCGASSGAGGGNDVYRKSLGTTTVNNLIQYTDEVVLTNYGYRFDRRETTSPENIRFETSWKDLTPTEDEQALGIQFTRCKIEVTGRPRNRTTGDLTARFLGECEYRMAGTASFVTAPLSDERNAYLEEISDRLETELRSNWRQ